MMQKFFQRSELTLHLWAFRREFLWVGFFSLIANVLLLTPTIYLLQLYERVFKSQSEITLLVVTMIMVLFFLVMAFAEWLRSRLLVRGGVRLDEALHQLVFNASFRRELLRKDVNPASAFSELTQIRQFLTGSGIFAFFDVPWTPVYIWVIFLLDPFLGWVSVLFACIQLVVTFIGHRATVGDITMASKVHGESSAYLHSKLRNIEAVHAMGMVGNLRGRWLALHDVSIRQSGKLLDRQHRQQSFSKFVRYCMQSFTLAAGALLVLDGKMGPGGMIAANVMMSRALMPLDLMMSVWKPMIQARDAFLRMEKLLADYPEVARITGPEFSSGDVSVEGLAPTVPNRNDPILDAIDFRIPAGCIVAVTGPSGAGKSTLARCLAGAWPGVHDRVFYDGLSTEIWSREEIGPHIGYLPQDIELFDGTIAENIARFGPVDSRKVIEAAQMSGVHDMVLRFPQGYNTRIGEGGGMLSGGQRQRIALARALYGKPEIVVLDEPNANLDDAGERSLVQALQELKALGAVVVLVTHRMNILSVADRLLVLKNGSVEHYGLRDGVLEVMRAAKASGSTQ